MSHAFLGSQNNRFDAGFVLKRQFIPTSRMYWVAGDEQSGRYVDEVRKVAPMERATKKVRRGKILVVEDNVDSRDLLAKLLGLNGYEVLAASDGESGYDAALKQIPDLIITDINMPRMDGIALLKKVRLESLLNDTAVFVVTAFGREAAREAIDAGADAATAKPFDFDSFVDTVGSLIFARRRRADDGC